MRTGSSSTLTRGRRDGPIAAVRSAGRRRRTVAVVVVCAGAALGLPAVDAAAAPVDLSPADEYAAGSDLAVDPAGDAVVVWQLGKPAVQGVIPSVQAAIRPAGGAFAAAVTVSLPGEEALGPRVAVDDAGDAVAVWTRFIGSRSPVRAQWRPRGTSARLSDLGPARRRRRRGGDQSGGRGGRGVGRSRAGPEGHRAGRRTVRRSPAGLGGIRRC